VAFTPDCRTLVTGSWDKTARLWGMASGMATAICEGHTQTVTGVAFTPNDQPLATVLWMPGNQID
jgi:WD40 repeat protein